MIDDEFFNAGLEHYPTAVRTIRDYEEVVHARLVQWVSAHAFSQFHPVDAWRDQIARHSPTTVDVFLSIEVPGRFAGDACKLELGLWWLNADPKQLVLYAGFHGNVPWRKSVKSLEPGTRVEGKSNVYLCRDLASTQDWTAVAAVLVPEFERAAVQARTA